MSHNLIKRGPKRYQCTVCDQKWTFESKAHCPHMRVISYADRGPLMSKAELGKRGYQTRFLPEATCCYRMTTGRLDVMYVKLYDPSQCALKKPRKHKVLHYVGSLHWPKAWGSFLDTIQQWCDENKKGEQPRVWREMCLGLARMASPLLFFTPDEITSFAGETINFDFPLIAIRTQWNESNVSAAQAEELVDLLLSRYRNWKWQNRPPLTEDEIEQRRVKVEERNRRGLQIVTQELQERFALPVWMTDTPELPPAIQKSLWHELEATS